MDWLSYGSLWGIIMQDEQYTNNHIVSTSAAQLFYRVDVLDVCGNMALHVQFGGQESGLSSVGVPNHAIQVYLKVKMLAYR